MAEIRDRKVLILWALELAEDAVGSLEETYPQDQRPRFAVDMARMWARGEIKMPEAKRAILACHAMAKEISSEEKIALCHAVGQACSVVHTSGHALGFPVYELTALVRRYGIDEEGCREAVEQRSRRYVEQLEYWSRYYKRYEGTWADFLCRTDKIRKS